MPDGRFSLVDADLIPALPPGRFGVLPDPSFPASTVYGEDESAALGESNSLDGRIID